MRLWLRAHRAARVSVVLVVTMALVVVVGDRTVPLPNLAGADPAGVPIALVLPLLAAAVLTHGVQAGLPDVEATAVRPAGAYLTGLVIATCAVSASAALGLTVAGVESHGFAAARNLAGFTGLALLGGAVWRHDAASVLPSAYLFAVALAGGDSWWAWPVDPSSAVSSLAAALTALAAGLATLPSPVRSRLSRR
ncbi:hypothetical protein [Streptosporangium sp. KLBMP 9127]|nr:hypothetical protein [Streptosporangium sp. KLBMP 9127]